MILCLDLSLKITGWAKFSKDGKLIAKGRITPDEGLDNCFKLHYTVERVKDLFDKVEELIIEDIFFGKNFKSVKLLAQLAGGCIYAWVNYKYKIPVFYNAAQARALAGVHGHSHKSEIQCFVIDRYGFAEPNQIEIYQKEIEALKKEKKTEKITKGQFDYRMDKLSEKIYLETGQGENICDAIVLGIAYSNKIKKLGEE